MRPFDVATRIVPVTPSSVMRPLLVSTSTSCTRVRSTSPFSVWPLTSSPAGTSRVYFTEQLRPHPPSTSVSPSTEWVSWNVRSPR